MKISQNTIDRIKSYILETQSNSTYNSSPHEPLELCYNRYTAEQWNLGNCYKYINRYLSAHGEKRSNIKDLLKACHYAWLHNIHSTVYNTGNDNIESFKSVMKDMKYFDTFIDSYITRYLELERLVQKFREDDNQINMFWNHWQYFQLATVLIELHETKDLDPT